MSHSAGRGVRAWELDVDDDGRWFEVWRGAYGIDDIRKVESARVA